MQVVKHSVCVDHAIIPRPFLFSKEDRGELSAEDRWWLDMLKVRWPFLHYMRALRQIELVFRGGQILSRRGQIVLPGARALRECPSH